MTTFQAILTIITVIIVTFSTRVLPFIFFPDTKKTPRFISYLGNVLPYSVMGMLIIYCLKDTSVFLAPYCIPELISIVFVIIVHKWKHNLLVSIGGGTLLYMFLVQMVF